MSASEGCSGGTGIRLEVHPRGGEGYIGKGGVSERALAAHSSLEDGSGSCTARLTQPTALLHCAGGAVPPDNAVAALALHAQDNAHQRKSR